VETRLLVLLAGAVRHKKPDKIVFVGKEANMDRRFQGWSYVDDLLPQLVTAHPQYARSLESAWAAARHGNWSSRTMRPIRHPLFRQTREVHRSCYVAEVRS